MCRSRSSCDHLDNTHHPFVLMVDGMAVIDETPDDHRIGKGDDHFSICPGPSAVAGGTEKVSRRLSSLRRTPLTSVTKKPV